MTHVAGVKSLGLLATPEDDDPQHRRSSNGSPDGLTDFLKTLNRYERHVKDAEAADLELGSLQR